ncbi:cytochrome P450/NADPH-cytochrome P450 reductase [Thermosporothrix hazakensis]|jgi:cytochrome P450/NADPH-cytochrome P450 reductase|uniref:Bifunctional cytochrome P450/NADPH--P450 reductase n=1 Tax=Thermosporothrix hazakensis TaxID=644383 RepID=A0A326UAP9_THEHA|nr:cytochrome P450 [Thermosporothrix hazakensis]PZW32010.1 cytochrome P450/NADPH-cytochrome P450 reductase [Thermosporothrix hazakensis]GCE49663.1 NADPH--cytochrome P450 reductase [Thermosporothrix hazakensis]
MHIVEKQGTVPIPRPPAKPFVGNLFDVDGEKPILGMMELARKYGPIFQLEVPGRSPVIVSGFELVDELSDEKRFDKKLSAPLRNVREFGGDGLFTAMTQEPNWQKAHNILLPNFSQRAMQGYFPMMLDIAEQLMEKWERLNADDDIDVPGDMTRLTLDTIGLCGFDYRFNSFYREDMHPFVDAMVRSLTEAMVRLRRLPLQDKLMVREHQQFQRDIDFMNAMVDKLIRERKERGPLENGKKDLLSYMLEGVDKQTGERLDDINIRYQIITFLIAGHETTSGLLSFALYFLLKHPDVLAKAYEEVDRVLGPDPTVLPTFAQINQLHYVSQILKEALRLWPTAPAFFVYPYEDTIIGGKYFLPKEKEITILIPMLHRDKSVWGEDAESFNPEHFSREAEQKRPANAYKPFGNGQRACIGRQFAMQEATLVMGMLLQRFELIDHLNYQLRIKQILTLKPEGFRMKVRKRTTHAVQSPVVQIEQPRIEARPKTIKQHNTPLLVLYGSNLGTAEDIAEHIAEDGTAYGFRTSVAGLDEYAGKLPREGAVVVVTASYNGTPPDNAVEFCRWLDEYAHDGELDGVRYTVFGCGNREWAATFQAIPRKLDDALERYGAKRLYQRGEGDASDDFDGQFQQWYQGLWKALGETFSLEMDEQSRSAQEPLFEVEVLSDVQAPNPFVASFGALPMRVLANRELHTKDGPTPSERSTRHIELALPEQVSYRAGDHLGIIARNHDAQIRRVAAHFQLDPEAKIRLRKTDTRKTHIPVDEPIRVYDLLADYVELQDVATRSQLKRLVEYTECPPEKMQLVALSGDDETSAALYRSEVLLKRKSLIDVLETYPACTLPFSIYLEMLAPIRPRYYSISSSPLQDPSRCTITVGVVQGEAKSGSGEYLGVCSNYLKRMQEGDTVYAFVRDSKSAFRLPESPETPLIMVGPGTGLAPFRGFLQERAALQDEGKNVGPSLLFFGCRHAQQDFIYEDELREFERRGLTSLSVAFSREYPDKKVYVQDKLKERKQEVWDLLQQGAVVYVCGDANKMAPDVRRTFIALYQEKMGVSAQAAELWMQQLTEQKRYLVDVWGS